MANKPRFRKWSLVTHRRSVRMHVLKIRTNKDGQYEYKIRYYNSIFGRAYWVPENELYHNVV